MDVTQVEQQLSTIATQQAQYTVDSLAYGRLTDAYTKILFKNMSIKEYTFIGQHLNRHMTTHDEAKLVVAAAQGGSLPDAVDLPASAKAAFLIRHGRQRTGMSQAELAASVGISQSQIARIENVSAGINLDLLQQVLRVLGETFVLGANA